MQANMLWRRLVQQPLGQKFLPIALTMAMAVTSVSAQAEMLLRSDLEGIEGYELLIWTNAFPPGSATDLHHHAGHEVLYVLDGEVQVRVGTEATIYGPGAVISVPSGSSMRVSNVSTKVAKTLVYMLAKKGAPLKIKIED